MLRPISVTFDSNVWECIADSAKLASHPNAVALQSIREAIEQGKVSPYICDVVVILESIRRRDRAEFFANIKTKTTRTEPVVTHKNSGFPQLSSEIRIQPIFDHFPVLHEKLSSALQNAFDMGFKLINVPRIGWMRLDDNLYKPLEPDEEGIGMRLDRTHHAAHAFEMEGCGAAWVTTLGNEAMQQHPEIVQRGIRSPLLAFPYCDAKAAIPNAVAEWADGDALAAHRGHMHDVFCSLDRGASAGARSILHQSRRQWLTTLFGIRVIAPTELAVELK